MLAGLYKPDSGEIIFDGVRVDDRTRQAYRELIAAIFPDYHLFEKLYGVPDPDPAEVDRLLTQFRLHDKTHLTDTQFSTLDLSAGQRKRLALIVALLEKRPLLLLDEWAADHAPEKIYVSGQNWLDLAGCFVQCAHAPFGRARHRVPWPPSDVTK